jgi:hypothetical protein
MFDAEIVALVAGLRGIVRGKVAKVEFTLPNFEGFVRSGLGRQCRDATAWARERLRDGAGDFELHYVSPHTKWLGLKTVRRSYLVYGERACIAMSTDRGAEQWLQENWVVDGGDPPWRTKFVRQRYLRRFEPGLSIDEATNLLQEAAQANAEFARADGQEGWDEYFEKVTRLLDGELLELPPYVVRLPKEVLTLEGHRLFVSVQSIPALTNMGGWSDGPFRDPGAFERCFNLLADARLRAFEACANSAY